MTPTGRTGPSGPNIQVIRPYLTAEAKIIRDALLRALGRK